MALRRRRHILSRRVPGVPLPARVDLDAFLDTLGYDYEDTGQHIAKQLAAAIGAELLLRNRDGGGLSAELRLPGSLSGSPKPVRV